MLNTSYTDASKKLVTLKRYINKRQLAKNENKSHTAFMTNTVYSNFKHDLIQMVGTALAVAALVVPLILWGIDAKFDGVRSEIESIKTLINESDRRYELRQIEAEKRQAQWQELMKDVIDAKTTKK